MTAEEALEKAEALALQEKLNARRRHQVACEQSRNGLPRDTNRTMKQLVMACKHYDEIKEARL